MRELERLYPHNTPPSKHAKVAKGSFQNPDYLYTGVSGGFSEPSDLVFYKKGHKSDRISSRDLIAFLNKKKCLWINVEKEGKWHKTPFAKSDKAFAKSGKKPTRYPSRGRGKSRGRDNSRKSSRRFSKRRFNSRSSKGSRQGRRRSFRGKSRGKSWLSRSSKFSRGRKSSRNISFDSRASRPWKSRSKSSRSSSRGAQKVKKKRCNKCKQKGHLAKDCQK